MRYDKPGAKPRVFTTQDGLPTNEVRALRQTKDGVVAVTPRGEARFTGKHWDSHPGSLRPQGASLEVAGGGGNLHALSLPPGITAQTAWRGGVVQAAIGGMTWIKNERRTTVPWPASKGSHVSALLARGPGNQAELWAGLFGDGLWIFNGKRWRRARPDLPPQAQEVTCLAGEASTLLAGTRRAGVWTMQGTAWHQLPLPDAPWDHNAQSLSDYGGVLFVSTLEDGLAVRAGDGWHHVESDLSSNAPRQMVEFANALWVRAGGGMVDKFDGRSWSKNVFPYLPRHKTLAIAGDKDRLYLGQWGGWSEWDGHAFTHHLNVAELQGLPPMTLLPAGNTLWFATQSRGIAEVDRTTEKVRWHDERLGLPDDWITCLLPQDQTILPHGQTLLAGTFVGGLATWNGSHWQAAPELKGENVTALESDGRGGAFVATRHGLWQRDKDGHLQSLHDRWPWVEGEVQSLLRVPQGLWIGTRVGIFFVTLADRSD